jgi:hypothetical protein
VREFGSGFDIRSHGRWVAESLFGCKVKTISRRIVATPWHDHLSMMKIFIALLLALSLGGCVWYGPGGYDHGWHDGGGGYHGGYGDGYNGGGGGYHQGGWH